jgi:hypothetical protein
MHGILVGTGYCYRLFTGYWYRLIIGCLVHVVTGFLVQVDWYRFTTLYLTMIV